jgi:hypothetical protein
MTQELMSPELVRQLAEHRKGVAKWRGVDEMNSKLVKVSVVSCVAIFIISLFAAFLSVGTGNVANWFGIFSVVTFIGGIALAIGTVVSVVAKIINSERPAPPVDPRTAEFIPE